MKLSELSYREYIALEVISAIVARGGMSFGDAAKKAFGTADAFLKECGKNRDEIAEIKRECDRLETQVSVLLNMGEDFAARVALTQIWEELGVSNQTDAMAALRDLQERAGL